MVIYSPVISGSLTISGSILTTGGGLPLTGSLVSSGSFTSIGATVVSGSFTVITGSSIELQVLDTGVRIGNLVSDNHNVTGSLLVSGSITTVGTITAQTLVVQTVTSSVSFITGSTKFGVLASNTHQFTGSVLVTGSVGIGTTPNITAGITELAIGSSNTNPLINGIRDGVSAFSLNSDSSGTRLLERRNLELTIGTNNTTRLTIASSGAATFSNNLAVGGSTDDTSGGLYTNIAINATTYSRYSLLTGGTARARFQFDGTNTSITTTSTGGKLQLATAAATSMEFITNDSLKMTITSGGLVGIGVTIPTGSLSIKAEQTNTPTIVFQNASGASSAISNFTVNTQTYTVIGTNAYVNNTGNISRFNTSYAGCYIAFDEGDIVFATGTSGATPTGRMRVLSGGDINTLGGNVRAIGGGYVLRDSANTTTGGLFCPRRNWLGTGTDISPTIAAETGYGVYIYTNGAASPSGPYVAPGGTTWTNGSSDVRKKKNFETTQGLEEILQIEPIKYHFNEDDDSSKKRLGFKAQNILPLIPEMVSETGEIAEDGSPYLTVTPDYILPVLVKAIQELKAENDTLKEILQRNNIQ